MLARANRRQFSRAQLPLRRPERSLMPLFVIANLLFGAISLAILGSGGYLLWSWWDGEQVRTLDGALVVMREDWRLWIAVGLLSWSLLGRLVILPLITRSGEDTLKVKQSGEQINLPDHRRIHLEAFGPTHGQPIVLIHGWGLDRTIWSPIRERLALERRVYVLDLPGLGRSRRCDAQMVGLEAFAAVLSSLLDKIGHPAIVVGHSIGGMTLQTLVRDNPSAFNEKVAGAILVNTTYTNPLRTMVASRLMQALRWPVLEPVLHLAIWLQPLAWLSAWQSYLSGSAHLANRLGFGAAVTRGQLEHTTLLTTKNPPAALARGNLAMLRWDATGAIKAAAAPILVIGGDRDIVTKHEASEYIAASGLKVELRTVHGANHMGFLEQAAVYGDLIERFADDNARARPI
ncbi:MAG: alpha/beta hydrolase [Caulobacter sp.]